MTTRGDFLAGAAALAATSKLGKAEGLSSYRRGMDADERPNILIFMPDQTQGQTVLPGYPCHTPNVNRFAKQGVLFNSSYGPYPHCCPARHSLW